ncbi:MAG TPA: hypothetical protein VGU69_00640 [Rhizomicrobium sp.]|nr:hypothetical protein [Rhizomicrobium sp.]
MVNLIISGYFAGYCPAVCFEMPVLLHFSEDPNIKVFKPHVPVSSPENAPMVWAVDEAHAPAFWFPRDCPRACCWKVDTQLSSLGRSLLGMGSAHRMHAIETAWLQHMRDCALYAYRFDAAPFALHNAEAGYYCARESITPLSVKPIGDVLALHTAANIELRVVPNLWPLIDAIVASGLGFSVIRAMNALPRTATPA